LSRIPAKFDGNLDPDRPANGLTENRDSTQITTNGPSCVIPLLPQPASLEVAGAEAARPPRDLAAIFAQEFNYVWRALARLGVAEADREDLAHEVFFQVHQKLAEADLDRPLRPWLFAFAFRIASSHRRLARHRFERTGESVEAIDAAPSPHEALERHEAQRLVDGALAQLSLEQRAVFVLHEIDGCRMPEIATALAIPLNTAYSRLRLGRTRFAATVRRLKSERGMP
jgi:RNA polymerase sigma-70 factor (ECF subfamily)